ncbi:thiopurine S-methyltransferase [Ancylobacter amanitiformis]|uniref:Thiopurine S-methyltransferase n=1 Tax=Ancylobacter amanitiformis TaxID=217069 RepID=A0ABU0LW41_9HYPH|nr:thiopurine S-methyltransferase [Ancylobacter amanitiformis]MDQ0512818.1 thiopurine S-methyltransferase [Ancylobacter amanitiformis]
MEPEFWHRKWERNEIAFHQAETNPLLLRHVSALGLAAGARVFVPLCGKSRDLHWLLAQGHEVVGAELSRLAVEQLFAELALPPRITHEGTLKRFEAERLTVFVGDIFDLDHATLGHVDAVYDRAALVALPEAVRTRYAAHLAAASRHAPQLLITLDYDPSLAIGPPFAVNEHEVRRLYGAAYHVAGIETRALTQGLKGVHPVRESAFLLTAR